MILTIKPRSFPVMTYDVNSFLLSGACIIIYKCPFSIHLNWTVVFWVTSLMCFFIKCAFPRLKPQWSGNDCISSYTKKENRILL